MKNILDVLILGVALLHVWFLVLEIFLWKKPIGLKVFRNTPEKAQITSVLAANQGLYNGFLAAGLLLSFCLTQPEMAHVFRIFFLSCVVIAGAFGAWTVSRRILWIQAFPAAVTLAGILFLHSAYEIN